jgi:hypothetical protein
MHHRQAINIIASIINTADKLGAPLPSNVRTEYFALTDLANKAREVDLAGNVAEAVLRALDAGKDIATDKGVLAAVIGQQVTENQGAINSALSDRAAVFLDTHADDLFGAFCTPFEGYATAISAAATKFGDIDPDNASAILAQGGDAAQVWAAARDAMKGIDAIHQTRKQLTTVSSKFRTDPRYVSLAIADIPSAEFVSQQVHGWLSPWELARRGFTLRLATPSVYEERVAGIHQELGHRTAARASDEQRATRQFFGHGAAR